MWRWSHRSLQIYIRQPDSSTTSTSNCLPGVYENQPVGEIVCVLPRPHDDNEGTPMMFFGILLALVGATAGLMFRWKVLLPVIVLLPFAAAIFFPASRGIKDTLIVVLVAEALLQGGYIAGLLIRFTAAGIMRSAPAANFLDRRRGRGTPDHDQRIAPRQQDSVLRNRVKP